MKKLFVVSDVHGFYTLMKEALDEAGFDIDNRDHIFVSLGDLLDRGEEPLQCLQFVNNLPDDRKILIRGNHEVLMMEMLDRGYPEHHDYHNRTISTVFDCLNVTEMTLMDQRAYEDVLRRFSEFEEWTKYYNSCITYWENNKNVFVHGWIPCKYKCLDQTGQPWGAVYDPDWRSKSWDGAIWCNGMNLWEQGVVIPEKTIWCGHWHTSWGHTFLHNDGVEWLDKIETYHTDPDTGKTEPHMNSNPFEDVGICAMDACTALTHHVNCKIIEIDESEMPE